MTFLLNRPTPVQVHRHGGSLCILLVKALRDALGWRAGDTVAVRVCGDKVILERVPMDSFAKIRTGELTPHVPEPFG